MARHTKNKGIALNFDWIESVQMNRSAIERRCSSMTKRRSIKKDWQAAWLLKSLSCIDLTSLSSDDTPERVRRLCAKALKPLRLELSNSLGLKVIKPQVAAVCVYHSFVKTAVNALKNSEIRVAAVSTGFPHGLNPLHLRIQEIKDYLDDKTTLSRAKELITLKTKQYSKRQFTWARGHMKSWEMIYSPNIKDLFEKTINKIS